ncbi:20808_t:CDS:1, partial [Gigaspora rosea]
IDSFIYFNEDIESNNILKTSINEITFLLVIVESNNTSIQDLEAKPTNLLAKIIKRRKTNYFFSS